MSRAALRRIYRRVPAVDCKGLSQEACGPIAMGDLEAERMVRLNGGPIGVVAEDLTCPLLTADGRCSVYGARPLICRLYGAAEDFRCSFGCRPTRYLTREESHALMNEVTKICGDEWVITLPERGDVG